jgi:hypothetical protein
MRKEVWIGWLSSLIEAYNMAIYSFLVPILIPLFGKPRSLLLSYSLVFIGSFFYPIGAAYYGFIGDKRGRRKTCIHTTLGLARISHTFSDSSHTLHDDLASQLGEAVLHEHCPRPLERQSQSAERRSVQKKCEKCGLGIATGTMGLFPLQENATGLFLACICAQHFFFRW